MRIRWLPLLLVAACTYTQSPQDREGTIVKPGSFRAGSGVIQSVGVLAGARAKSDQPADAKAPLPDPNLYRLYILMDQGGFQSVDVDNATFAAGDTVELTNDGRVEHVSGTSLQDALRK